MITAENMNHVSLALARAFWAAIEKEIPADTPDHLIAAVVGVAITYAPSVPLWDQPDTNICATTETMDWAAIILEKAAETLDLTRAKIAISEGPKADG